MENTFWCSMARLQTIVISKYIRRILFLVALVTLLTSCAPSMNSLEAYVSCMHRYESIVKADQCAHNKMSHHQRNGGTVYSSDPDIYNYIQGLVYKVKSNQISNSEAKNRLTAYEQQKINARRENARQIGEVSDGLNCLLFGVACN